MRADPTIEFGPLPVDLPGSGPIPTQLPPGLPSGHTVKPLTLPPGNPKGPSGLGTLSEAVRNVFEPIGKALGLAWPVMQWVLIAIGAVIVLYGLYRIVAPWLERGQGAGGADESPEWSPEQAEAEALLDDADALAAQGRFAEATHLLLVRSVDHIAAARPEWVLPASTTREISAIAGLPAPARSAFALIAQRVERSLFALRGLDEADWQAARAAYADFALQRLPGSAA